MEWWQALRRARLVLISWRVPKRVHGTRAAPTSCPEGTNGAAVGGAAQRRACRRIWEGYIGQGHAMSKVCCMKGQHGASGLQACMIKLTEMTMRCLNWVRCKVCRRLTLMLPGAYP